MWYCLAPTWPVASARVAACLRTSGATTLLLPLPPTTCKQAWREHSCDDPYRHAWLRHSCHMLVRGGGVVEDACQGHAYGSLREGPCGHRVQSSRVSVQRSHFIAGLPACVPCPAFLHSLFSWPPAALCARCQETLADIEAAASSFRAKNLGIDAVVCSRGIGLRETWNRCRCM